MNRFLRTTALACAAATTFVACGDDDSSSADGIDDIDDIDEWCATVEDIDNRFSTTDNSDDPFDQRQDAYAEINELLRSLDASIELVDSDSRDAVAESIGWAIDLTDTVVAADSEESLDLFGEDGFFATREEPDQAGAEWIAENCGVDLDGEE